MISSQIQDPVGAWLAETFPYLHVLRAEIAADLRRHPILRIDPPDKSFFGNVVELAIGLTLCDRPPYLTLVRCLGHGRAARLLSKAGYLYLPATDVTTAPEGWQRGEAAPHPAHIFTAASRLARVRYLFYALGRDRSDAPDITGRILEQHPQILHGRADEAYHARRAFRTVWSSYSAGFRSALRSYGPATAQLPLLDGARHADFLLGTTLLEVKSGRLDEDRYLDELIRQIMTYALLAHHDGHHVTHVAVYAVRYQRLLRYRVEELTGQLADTPIDLPAAAAHLATAIRNRPHRRPAVCPRECP